MHLLGGMVSLKGIIPPPLTFFFLAFFNKNLYYVSFCVVGLHDHAVVLISQGFCFFIFIFFKLSYLVSGVQTANLC